MRTFLTFLLLVAVAALISGAVTYPVWAGLQLFTDAPIHRVMNRLGMLALAVLTIIWLRQRGLANKATLGYGLPRPQFVRQMLWGFTAGVLLMMPLVVALFELDLRVLSSRIDQSDAPALLIAKLIFRGLLTGWVVAFLEETFCRGAMFAAIKKESGLVLAVLLPSLLYAALHFLGGELRLPADQITYTSGFTVTANLFERYAAPLEFLDSFMALVALGVLLALIRWRTGVIAGCIGLHAGGVCVILVMRNLSMENPAAPHSWLIGSYDGVIGWMACLWIAFVALAYWWLTRRSVNGVATQ
jgi:membrane protease YdiL (CAAX protease family)